MNKTEFNREFIIRYYPDSSNRHDNQLVGFAKMQIIIADLWTFARIKASVERFKGDKLTIKLKRGISFDFKRR